jgi:hypothetical protein
MKRQIALARASSCHCYIGTLVQADAKLSIAHWATLYLPWRRVHSSTLAEPLNRTSAQRWYLPTPTSCGPSRKIPRILARVLPDRPSAYGRTRWGYRAWYRGGERMISITDAHLIHGGSHRSPTLEGLVHLYQHHPSCAGRITIARQLHHGGPTYLLVPPRKLSVVTS